MRNVIMYKEGEQSWVRWIKKRIDNNLNFLAIATGSTGIGKSYSMIRIAYDIDPEFEARQIAFSFKKIMEILNSDWFMKKKWRIIIFDEVQIDISSRQWQSLTNKLFNYLLSTFRHRNVILLFTSPYSDFIDLASRKLLHAEFQCRGWSKKTNKSHIRPKLLQYNSKMKKFYEHSLYVIRDKKMNKMVNWLVDKPPKYLIDPYEEMKLEFTDKLNKKIFLELEQLENKDKEDKPKKPLTELQEKILELWKKKYKQKDIAEELNKDQAQISRNEGFMRNKGYYKEEICK